jgi:hypothetical protein
MRSISNNIASNIGKGYPHGEERSRLLLITVVVVRNEKYPFEASFLIFMCPRRRLSLCEQNINQEQQ